MKTNLTETKFNKYMDVTLKLYLKYREQPPPQTFPFILFLLPLLPFPSFTNNLLQIGLKVWHILQNKQTSSIFQVMDIKIVPLLVNLS